MLFIALSQPLSTKFNVSYRIHTRTYVDISHGYSSGLSLITQCKNCFWIEKRWEREKGNHSTFHFVSFTLFVQTNTEVYIEFKRWSCVEHPNIKKQYKFDPIKSKKAKQNRKKSWLVFFFPSIVFYILLNNSWRRQDRQSFLLSNRKVLRRTKDGF